MWSSKLENLVTNVSKLCQTHKLTKLQPTLIISRFFKTPSYSCSNLHTQTTQVNKGLPLQNSSSNDENPIENASKTKASVPGKKQRSSLLSETEHQEFIAEFPHVLNDVTNLEGFEAMTETNEWTRRVLEYNLPQGKHFRSGLMIRMAKEMQNNLGGKALPNLNKIGWTFEFFHAYGLILDDMMDGSSTRRRRPCWYLVEDLGMAAINDGLLCGTLSYVLLAQYAKDYALSQRLLHLFHHISLKCIHGQSLDLLISRHKRYDKFTEETYRKMMTFKNGFYTFYKPIACALLMNGIKDAKVLKSVEKVSTSLGIFFSMQDDYLDCFVDPKISGKVGTDIQDGTCTWLVVNALKRATVEQRKILLKNYGQNNEEKVAAVKSIYSDLCIPEIYLEAQDQAFEHLQTEIKGLPALIPRKPLEDIATLLHKRYA